MRAATTSASANTLTRRPDRIGLWLPRSLRAGDFGAGQTVAIYELEGNFPTDITAYESCYGTSAPVSYQSVDGGPGARASNGDGLETELDIENVVGLAPKANVIVYQGPNSSSAFELGPMTPTTRSSARTPRR